MLVAIPVCNKDLHLVLANLELCRRLEACCRHVAVVSRDTSFGGAPEVIKEAKGCFLHVLECVYSPPAGHVWPEPQNWAWQSTARFMAAHGQPWLWWEADAVPLKPGWLDDLEAGYMRAGLPFFGHVCADGHMNGVAVYPAQISSYIYRPLMVRHVPFDRVLSADAATKIAPANQLIGHYTKEVGGGAGRSFTKGELQSVYQGGAVLFHGCTDQSIHKNLSIGRRRPRLKLSSVAYPRIIHCVERHKHDAWDRTKHAWESWLQAYRHHNVVAAHLWGPQRDSRQVGDGRCLPFLKDVLAEGLNRANADDIIMLTNDDTVLGSSLPPVLRDQMRVQPCCASFRLNYQLGADPRLGKADYGRDLFAFRTSWLRDNWKDIPDFLLGELEWDLVLATMVRLATKTKLEQFHQPVGPAELPLGHVFHVEHNANWKQTNNPGRQHNLGLMRRWYRANGLSTMITA